MELINARWNFNDLTIATNIKSNTCARTLLFTFHTYYCRGRALWLHNVVRIVQLPCALLHCHFQNKLFFGIKNEINSHHCNKIKHKSAKRSALK